MTVGIVLLVVGICGAIFLHSRDEQTLAMARVAVERGRYASAEGHIASVRLPFSGGSVSDLRVSIRESRSHDDVAWKALSVSARALSGAATDRNSNGDIPSGVADDFARGLRDVLARPAVMASSRADLSSHIANLALPKRVAVIVTDLRTVAHAARVVRFVISNPTEYASGPTEDKNQSDCFRTGLTCWDFNSAYSRLLVATPPDQDVPSKVFDINGTDDGAAAGTFEGVRLLDWTGGLALSIAGSYAASNGGNNGETWWHVWRLDRSGKSQFDGDLLPFKVGVDALGVDKASGIAGRDYGAESTPFQECHACPHVSREFVATWSSDGGRYRVSSTRIHPSSYATLVRYVQSEKGGELLDSSANIAHLRGMREFVNRLKAGGTPCSVTGGADDESKVVVTELRLGCGYWTIGVKAVRHGTEWNLSDAYQVSSQ